MALRSLAATVVFSIAVGAFAMGIFQLAHWPYGLEQLAMLAFLAILTGALLAWQENGLIRDPKGFMARFMIGLMLKLLVAVAVVAGLLLLLPRAKAISLALTFTVFYLLFLIFTTVRLSIRSRHAPRP